jgi:NodT family efflux transporter outer membrane factor (OMF) lipoprotein
MSSSKLTFAALTTLAALGVGGCTVGPNYAPPKVPVPDHYGTTQPSATQPTTASAAPVDLARWWESFNDPMLNSLIERAVKSNLDLRVATSRVLESRAQRQIQTTGLFPVANASASYARDRFSKNGFYIPGAGAAQSTGATAGTTGRAANSSSGTGSGGSNSSSSNGLASAFNRSEIDTWQGGFDASWEIDLFGGVQRTIEAARADEQAAVDARRDTLVTLLAEVARNYIDVRGLQRELAIARDNVRSQQDTVELTRSRFKAGLATDLDVARAEAQVAMTQSQIPALETSRQQAVHHLGILLGQDPISLRAELTPDGPIPPPPPQVPVGLPSELLRRRPDIRRAERELASATANIGVATADLFPRFALTGGVGLAAGKVNEIFRTDSAYYSIGPAIQWRIFDAGRIQYNIRVQNARQQESLGTYQATVLRALEDVENALVGYDQERQRWQALAQAVNANQRAVDLAQQLYTKGLTDFLNVLESQRNLFASQDQLAQSERNLSSDVVALYKALGGGWESQEPTRQPDRGPSVLPIVGAIKG